MRATLGLLALLVVTGAAASPKLCDPWQTLPRVYNDAETWTSLDDFVVLPVGQDKAALKLLARHKVVALDCAAFAEILPGTPCPHDAGRKPYLVRAVELLQSLGGIRVSTHGADVDVNYNGPIEPGTPRHRAVILYLQAPPKRLYVSVTLYS
jgi:hypothetical protein